VISVEPHVEIKMRRYWGMTNRATKGGIRVPFTMEKCADIHWFSQRYPITPHPPTLLTKNVQRYEERALMLEQILGPDYAPKPFDMALPPRNYQARHAEACIAMGSVLNADDLGAGKTAAGIALISRPECRPAVVVVPTHLARQWRDEFARFLPQAMVHIIKTGKHYELPKFFGQAPDVLIITYHKLSKWASVLSKFAKTIVFDEIQALRHSTSDRYRAAEIVAAACKYRMGLSATPIYNYGGEFYNIARVLRPNLLGDKAEFYEAWCSGFDEKAKIKDPRAFGSYLRDSGFMIRHTRKDIGRELPAVTKIIHKVDSDPAALDKIQGDAVRLAKLILSEQKLGQGAAMMASEEFSVKLRQATGIAKAPYVADFTRMLAESGERIVLVGWHREVYEIWKEKLKDLRVCMYTGTESPNQKEQSKKDFIAGKIDVMILSLRSGEGLDGLQKASSVIVFGELDWAYGVMEQCIGRLNRDGQDSPVLAYYLVSDGGIDPMMSQILGLKRSQLVGMRDPDAPIVEQLQGDSDRVRKLAESYLAGLGKPQRRDDDEM
jgi:SNF2 family DNA or RNA helicase